MLKKAAHLSLDSNILTAEWWFLSRLCPYIVPKQFTFPSALNKLRGVVPGMVDRWHHLILLSLEVDGIQTECHVLCDMFHDGEILEVYGIQTESSAMYYVICYMIGKYFRFMVSDWVLYSPGEMSVD